MLEIREGSSQGLPDVNRFIDLLNRLDQHEAPEARGFFGDKGDIFFTRAPGRLDVMGGIADYSGSLVLQLPTREATFAAFQVDSNPSLTVVSLGGNVNDRATGFEMPLSEFSSGGQACDYRKAQAYFRKNSDQAWAAYALGVFLVLMIEKEVSFSTGARILISSDVPEAKGVSSSAAIEVAVMQAVSTALEISLQPREMALLCQMVENLVVGAPCGVMDQMTSVCGEADRLLAILCQPAELRGSIPIPDHVGVWGIDSGIRHAVSGADYGSVRVGAFMGYQMIAEAARLPIDITDGRADVEDPDWRGYLANVTPSVFRQRYADELPDRITGKEFLASHGGTTDRVTQVEPEKEYRVRVPTEHPVYEHFRVRTFADLLLHSQRDDSLRLLGELMYQSHASYSACGLGSDGTDLLVQLVRDSLPGEGLYGAKITGGGSGGTVAILGRADAGAAVEGIAYQYEEKTGHRPYVFSGSSPGSSSFEPVRLSHSSV